MKKIFILSLFYLFITYLFSFEIIVIGRKDTMTTKINTDDFYSSAFLGVLKLNTYGIGSIISPAYPGLSSSNTALIFNGISFNSLKTGGGDLSNIPAFIMNNVEIYDEDISYYNGINGIGGCINIQYEPLKKIYTHLYMDKNYSLFSIVYPLKFNNFLINLMYENGNGDSGRTNSDFKRQYFGISLSPIKNMHLLYVKSFENLGVPGPLPPEDSTSIFYNGTDATFPYNRQDSIYENLFLKYSSNIFFGSMNFSYSNIKYRYYSFGYSGISNNEEQSSKFFAKFNLMDTLNYGFKIGTNYIQLNDEDRDFNRENIFIQFHVKKMGLGLNAEYYVRDFAKGNIAGNFYYENYIKNTYIFLSLSKGIRFPTYNELYYPYGGNPYLKDENSVNFTAKLRYKFLTAKYDKKYIKNMILWVPQDLFYYKAENIGKKSIDQYSLIFDYDFSSFSIRDDFSLFKGWEENIYSDSNGENYIKRENASYLPDIKNKFLIVLNIKNIKSFLNVEYTGLIRNNYINKNLPPRFVIDFSIKYGYISAGIKNLLNNTNPINFGYTQEDRDFPSQGRTFFIKWQY